MRAQARWPSAPHAPSRRKGTTCSARPSKGRELAACLRESVDEEEVRADPTACGCRSLRAPEATCPGRCSLRILSGRVPDGEVIDRAPRPCVAGGRVRQCTSPRRHANRPAGRSRFVEDVGRGHDHFLPIATSATPTRRTSPYRPLLRAGCWRCTGTCALPSAASPARGTRASRGPDSGTDAACSVLLRHGRPSPARLPQPRQHRPWRRAAHVVQARARDLNRARTRNESCPSPRRSRPRSPWNGAAPAPSAGATRTAHHDGLVVRACLARAEHDVHELGRRQCVPTSTRTPAQRGDPRRSPTARSNAAPHAAHRIARDHRAPGAPTAGAYTTRRG